jgi:hypothetical protein
VQALSHILKLFGFKTYTILKKVKQKNKIIALFEVVLNFSLWD